MEGYRIIFHGCGDYCTQIPLGWASLLQPHTRNLLSVFYSRATLSCLNGLTQACDHSKGRLRVSQGRSLEEQNRPRSSRKSFDHCLSFLVDSHFSTRNDRVSLTIPPVAVELTHVRRNEEFYFKANWSWRMPAYVRIKTFREPDLPGNLSSQSWLSVRRPSSLPDRTPPGVTEALPSCCTWSH